MLYTEHNITVIEMDINESLLQEADDSYSVVYADPPWSYARQVGNGVLKKKRGPEHYQTMTNADIVGMGPQIQRITRKNSALLLWATMPNLPVALETMQAWGFKYKTCFATWVKTNKAGNKPFFGVGYYTRSNAELCLLGVRGKIASYKHPLEGEVQVNNPNAMTSVVMLKPEDTAAAILADMGSTCVEAPREHSRKPNTVRDNIVTFFGNVPRVELFAREKAPGWTILGNQDDKFDEQMALALGKDKRRKITK